MTQTIYNVRKNGLIVDEHMPEEGRDRPYEKTVLKRAQQVIRHRSNV